MRDFKEHPVCKVLGHPWVEEGHIVPTTRPEIKYYHCDRCKLWTFSSRGRPSPKLNLVGA
jgi:hypothetical protein